MFQDVRIETERLIIRSFTMDDLADFYDILRRPDVMRHLPEDPLSREKTSEILSWLIECYEENTPNKIQRFTLAVTHPNGNRLIGWCGLGSLEFNPSEIELYYGLAPQYWGKGLATEAARAMLDYGFRLVGLKRIVAVVKPENIASKRVLEKLGMVHRGQLANLLPEYDFFEGVHYFYLTRQSYDNRRKRSH